MFATLMVGHRRAASAFWNTASAEGRSGLLLEQDTGQMAGRTDAGDAERARSADGILDHDRLFERIRGRSPRNRASASLVPLAGNGTHHGDRDARDGRPPEPNMLRAGSSARAPVLRATCT